MSIWYFSYELLNVSSMMRLIFLVSTKMMGIEDEQWVEVGVGEEKDIFCKVMES